MFGILLTIIGSFFEEAGNSAGKTAVKSKIESIYTLGFVTNLCCAVLFAVMASLRWQDMAIGSWTTLMIRFPIELLLAHFSIIALTRCTRSTFGFLRTGTIPLLAIVDLFMGYGLDFYQILGILIISAALLFLHINHGLEKKGLKFAVLATIMPVVTISLAKYNFSHGNSWELEQALVLSAMAIYFYTVARSRGEKPFLLFKKPMVILQATITALGSVLLVWSLSLITPSIHTTVKRSTAVIAAVASGGIVFHEKKMLIKAVTVIACIIGIALLAI